MGMPVEVLGPVKGTNPEIIKTLLLDDSTFDRARIRRLSGKTKLLLDITEVSSIAELETMIAREVFDLILIDFRLPQGNGFDVLSYIQESSLNSDAATIMITGNGDMDTAVTAMRSGCHDFLTKDVMTAPQLRDAMMGALQTARAHRDLVAQSSHQREIIRQGLCAALMDSEVQGTVVALFKDQFDEVRNSLPNTFTLQQSGDLDALLATLGDDDEFIFN